MVNIVAVESVVPTRNTEYLMYMICLIFKSVNYIFCIFFSGKLLIRTKRTNTNSIGIISEPWEGTGVPRYIRSFYLRFRVYATENWQFFWKLSSNLQSSLDFLFANSLYASIFFWSLSLPDNEGYLYLQTY